MTPELTVLALAGLLQSVQFILVSVPANRQLGSKVTLAPRDDGPLTDKVDPRTARLARALDNHFSALILFTMAVTVVTLSGQSTALTVACAWIYLLARAIYVPAYALGWMPWRSVFWATGWGATVTMLLAALI